MKSSSELRARVVLKDYAVNKVDDLHAPTPTSMTVRCLVFYAAWFELEVGTSDVRVAFMHLQLLQNPSLRNLQLSNAQPRMAVADQESNEWNENSVERFRGLGADVIKEIQFERGKAEPQIYTKTPNPKH